MKCIFFLGSLQALFFSGYRVSTMDNK
jgi:hypothetical protein